MAATQQKQSASTANQAGNSAEAPHRGKIDPSAPAGSRNSLGEESIRDGRPATDDSIVEAIDEVDPGTVEQPSR